MKSNKDDSRAPREWVLPLKKLIIINSSFTRGGDEVHVIEKSAYEGLSAQLMAMSMERDQLAKELAELKTHCELLRDGAKMQTLDEAQKELAEARAEIFAMQSAELSVFRQTDAYNKLDDQLQSQAALIEKLAEALGRYKHIRLPERDSRISDKYAPMPLVAIAADALAEIEAFKK